jgi:antitoxin FitA
VAVLTIRNIDDAVKASLRIQAAEHGWSMEEEARQILARAVQESAPAPRLGSRLAQRFAGLGEVKLPVRKPARGAPDFSAAGSKPRTKRTR